MTLQEQIRDAWGNVQVLSKDEDWLIPNAIFTVGLLTGSGYPYAACLVISLTERAVGKKHPEMVELRQKMGLEP